MTVSNVKEMAERVAALMEDRLGIPGHGLAAKVARSRRDLPRHLRAEAQRLAEALPLAENPKLARRLDHARLTRSYKALVAYLDPLGRGERRLAIARSIGASIALALLGVGGLFLAVLVWRGLL